MQIHICHHETQGLANDALVLANVLKSKYRVSIIKYPETVLYTDRSLPPHGDIRIFLEHVSPHMMNAKCNIFIPNIEMMNSNDIRCARDMNTLVAKTKHAYDVLTKQFPESKVEYWGWSSIDRVLTNVVPDYNQFLHVKGVSRFKNTQLVLETWLKHPEWPTLTILHYGDPKRNEYVDIPVDHFMVADNVRMIQRKTTDTELAFQLNRCGVHVCPSNLEGFGHYINEALSARALVVTTDGHPMKQFVDHGVNGFLIPPVEEKPHSLGICYTLDMDGFEKTIQRVIDTPIEQRATMGNRSREIYEHTRFEPAEFP
jgi:glycosyltransferase involved in cell wall biosynthesis